AAAAGCPAVEGKYGKQVQQPDEHVDRGEGQQQTTETGFVTDRGTQLTDADDRRRPGVEVAVRTGQMTDDVDRIEHLDDAADALPHRRTEVEDAVTGGLCH